MEHTVNKNNYAFISYSTKNQTMADMMCDLLQKNNITTWMAPIDIPAGSKYAQIINIAIKKCSCFVLMLSEDSQNSIWVAKETERAINYRKPIIPVQLEKLTLNDEFELYISTDQIVALSNFDENSIELMKLIDDIKKYTKTNSNNMHENTKLMEEKCFLIYKNDNKKRIGLKKGSYLMGRDDHKCAITIDEVSVSRIHAILNVTDNEVSMKDLNAINGTYVNGEKLCSSGEKILNSNDIIKFGKAEFIIEIV